MRGSPDSGAGRVHQLLPALHRGDAVGNEALIWRGQLREAGLESEIYAGGADHALAGEARPLQEWPAEDAGVVTIFHFGPGSPAGGLAAGALGPLVLRYHNVTPATFLAAWAPGPARLAALTRQELGPLARRTALGLADSEFNRRDLVELGCPRTAILPLARDLEAPRRPRSPVVRRLYGDGRTNVLVVGRIAPNKRLEDVVLAFAAYQRLFDRGSRLLLAGSERGLEAYGHALRGLVGRLGLERVVFLGHVDDDDLRALYSVAHALLSLSEHEGFCVPLLEAMEFGIPVLAYDAGAVGETLGEAGTILRDKRPELVAGLLARLVGDAETRAGVLRSQRARIEERRPVDDPAALLQALRPALPSLSP